LLVFTFTFFFLLAGAGFAAYQHHQKSEEDVRHEFYFIFIFSSLTGVYNIRKKPLLGPSRTGCMTRRGGLTKSIAAVPQALSTGFSTKAKRFRVELLKVETTAVIRYS